MSPSTMPQNGELREVLERAFGEPILRLAARPSAYSSSFVIEELDLEFAGGSTSTILFKNVGPGGLFGDASHAKPQFLRSVDREIQVYRNILSPLAMGTPRLYAGVTDADSGRYWLLLEKAPGVELYQIGDIETWLAAARWLARFHGSPLCCEEHAARVAPSVLRYDATFHRQWFERANAHLNGALAAFRECHERAVRVLSSLPRTLVHGEFYASNILVDSDAGRICPVDWETAGVGPGLLDVAALSSGKWNDAERMRMAAAYWAELPRALRPECPETAFLCCQAQIAIQWLGWAPEWTPPVGHRHNWLAEAKRLFAILEEMSI